ncbi:MAG: biopolymer transporter ExbD [Myxococcales bacterium]|nr:biopolymer transporter ExbD [Myxococcales bacterium]
MARKKKNIDDKIEDLNLVPIMNLVVCLIPIVLLGTSLVKIGVINVNAPKFGMGQAAPDDSEEKPLNLTVAVGEDGFRITASGADINQVLGLAPAAEPGADPAEPAAAGPLIAKQGENYDYVELYNKLVQIKEKFPEETIINLTADARIPFKVMINTMDSIRVRLDKDSYEDIEGFKAASVNYEGNTVKLLWPDVVFAVAQ